MAFRGEDQDYRWPHRGSGRDERHHHHARQDVDRSLALNDTLRELAITVVGFLGIIALIVAAVSALHG